ncbi:glycosyltransferase [Patescibacteria group bacterium]
MSKLFLSVVIPSYNEEANLKRGVLSEIHDFMLGQNISWEVIISDDGSTDGSRKFVDTQIKNWKHFTQLQNKHGGKPYALWQGIKKARGKFVLFADMDQSTPIDQVLKLIPYTKKNFSVVIGSRGLNRENFPLYRKIGSAVFMTFRKSLILSEIDDTQCGFKMFDRVSVKKAFPKLEFFRKKQNVTGWKVTSYDVELLHILKNMGNKIKEVKVDWDDRDESTSKGGALKKYANESLEMILQILRIKMNDRRGMYTK